VLPPGEHNRKFGSVGGGLRSLNAFAVVCLFLLFRSFGFFFVHLFDDLLID